MSDLSIQSARGYRDRLSDALKRHFTGHLWLLAYATLYISIVLTMLASRGLPYRLIDMAYFISAIVPPVVAMSFIVFGHCMHHAFHVRPFRLQKLSYAIRNDDKFTLERAVQALFLILLIPLFSSLFSSFKNAIPHIVPFAHDQSLMALDYWIHFGNHPWELLQPILGYPIVTSAISYLYNLWMPIMFVILWWQIFSMKNPRLRMQYLLSFVLIWSLLGNLLALAFSSAGPCYYGFFVEGVNPYEPLMAYLREVDDLYMNWSLLAQDYLWQNYTANKVATAGGISAAPSLHIAVAVLQALMAWKVAPRLGRILAGYALIIVIGSIHLGWHYAVDGYMAIVLAILIWQGVGWSLKHHPLFSTPNSSK